MTQENSTNTNTTTEDQPLPTIQQAISAIYANRFYLLANDHIMRFFVGDSITGTDLDFKMSFVMTRADAADLAQTITNLLAQTDPTKPK